MTSIPQPSSSAGAHRLPTGTVTFLFSDIEGSTRRWEAHRAAMDVAIKKHDAHLLSETGAHGGHVFKTVGDAFCVVFARVSDALAASIQIQQSLSAEDFSAVGGLRVRCALHTGEAVERNGDYFGPAVNRAARLMSIGHGGQILVSGVTHDLARDGLPAGSTLVDLGTHRLRDLIEPERVWQLNAAGLPTEFPPLHSLDALPNNLPIAPTTFVGREDDVADVEELLERHRLLTLVGSGGLGKTRLAVRVGAKLLERYPDGVWFVDLAPIEDSKLATSVIAQALSISQQEGRQIDEAILQWLAGKKLLLILDNCEHVVNAVAAIASSISVTASDVRILATSRQALDAGGEVVHRLPALSVPTKAAHLTASDAMRYDAVSLFVDRAYAADTRFILSDDSAPIVADICRRLDGIPLAIELAAARVTVLSIPNLAYRLDERFKLLTGGSRSALPRQKTLGALIDWSYDLLTAQEQLLFAKLGIFTGGFSLEAATRVSGIDRLDELEILDLLSSLTDKSLVVADTSGERERYRLLESTSAYALEKLGASGQREVVARRHAEYFRDLAEAADEPYGTASALAWVADVELGNYRTALTWALIHGNDAAVGGAIAGALSRLWTNAGLRVEGRHWIELALERIDETAQPQIAARLRFALAWLSFGKHAHDQAHHAVRLHESVGDVRGAARARRVIAYALYEMGRLDEASAANRQTLATLRECGDERGVAACLNQQAGIESPVDGASARDLYAQALAAYQALGDESETAGVLANMAELEFADGDAQQALRFAGNALELDLRGGNAQSIAIDYSNIAAYRIAVGDVAAARESARDGLRFARKAQHELFIPIALQHFALLAGLAGDAPRAARILGYVDAQYGRLVMKRGPTEQWCYEQLLPILRGALSEEERVKLADEGAGWSEDWTVGEALKL